MLDINISNYRQNNLIAIRGNQSKWNINKYWIKEDNGICYEALSEVIASRILEKSNLSKINYVKYHFANLYIDGISHPGCISYDCKGSGEKLRTLEDYFKFVYNFSFSERLYEEKVNSIYNIYDNSKRDYYKPIKYYVDTVNSELNGYDYGKFLTAVIELDALILNSDRHTNNLALLINNQSTVRICPIFDNGAAFFSNIIDYPETNEIEKLIGRSEDRPFYSFDKQKLLCEELYGKQFKTSFNKEDLFKVLDEASVLYRDDILKRVEKFVLYQIEKYKEDLVFDKLENKEIIFGLQGNVSSNDTNKDLDNKDLNIGDDIKTII